MPVVASSSVASFIFVQLLVFSHPLVKIRYLCELMEPLESL